MFDSEVAYSNTVDTSLGAFSQLNSIKCGIKDIDLNVSAHTNCANLLIKSGMAPTFDEALMHAEGCFVKIICESG